jgi:2-keto-4-pentenoate hydratase/2-oxohepta-3-ene-1,7-dioic acid hydratase in catechol pathway
MRIGRVRLTDQSVHFAEFVDGGARLLDADPIRARPSAASVVTSSRDYTLLAPVVPGKIVCVGRNYAEHAKELGNAVPEEPMLFMKPPSSVIGPDDVIVRPSMSTLVHHEGELAVVIGRRLQRASTSEAKAAVFGLTCANDVTARDLQRKDNHFTRAKGFDTFCPLGPTIVTDVDWQGLEVTLDVNGERRQTGNTRDQVHGVENLLAYISQIMTLEPGDVVLTGTPAGVGPLLHGDHVVVDIAGIGSLHNRVVDADGTR